MSHCWGFWCRFSDAMLSYTSHFSARAWQMRGTSGPPAYSPTMGCETAGKAKTRGLTRMTSFPAALAASVVNSRLSLQCCAAFSWNSPSISLTEGPSVICPAPMMWEIHRVSSYLLSDTFYYMHPHQEKSTGPRTSPNHDPPDKKRELTCAPYPPHLAQEPRYVPQQNSSHHSSSLGFEVGYANSRGNLRTRRSSRLMGSHHRFQQEGGRKPEISASAAVVPYPTPRTRITSPSLFFEPTPSTRSITPTAQLKVATNRAGHVLYPPANPVHPSDLRFFHLGTRRQRRSFHTPSDSGRGVRASDAAR
ncbi:hypothetical protein EDB85DRAFT_1887579 [Lactarius pseudohatsudake]|nr:hypothetical protein EDB85DRAFT_1887579 [Lactarius pseudohatsudake]